MKRSSFIIPAFLASMLLACDSSENVEHEFIECAGDFMPVEIATNEVMLSITTFTSKTQMSQDTSICYDYVLQGNQQFLYVMGDCRYYAFSPEGMSVQNWWADIYTGTLSEAECLAFQKEMMVGRFENKCRTFPSDFLESKSINGYGFIDFPRKTPPGEYWGNYISDGNGWVYCDNMTCQPTGEDICFQDIFTNASKWRQHMFDHGLPLDSDLRGLLVIENDGKYESYVEGVNISFERLPEGLEQYAVEKTVCQTWTDEDQWGGDFPRGTIVFPQEYQSFLKEVRAEFIEKSRQGLLFPTTLEGIPFKDAEGQKYTLYVRSTIPELEDEIGRLPMPSLCADEDIIQ